MGSGDDQAFKVNFSGEGVTKLREKVQVKLMEFMGDYSDDTLVEYVMVLLRNGRNKGEAKNELDVFLGDDSDSFVSWLWDHLGSNINLYVQQQKAPPDRATQTNPAAKNETQSDPLKPDVARSRHKREWRGLLRDIDEHQAVVVDTTSPKMRNHPKLASVVQSTSPDPETQRKRVRSEDSSTKKRESSTQPNIAAPRRLLQFAVRDALATSRQSNSSSEPSLKRLRSVVSTTSTEEPPPRMRSVARLANPEAIADVAKDRKPVRPSSNVFDRLGSAPPTFPPTDQLELMEEDASEGEDEKFVDVSEVPSRLPVEPVLDQDQPAPTNHVSRIEPLNINTWKSPKYQEAQNNEKGDSVISNNGNNAKPSAGAEDSDSRTIFVNNVHFAATKDSLLRHFNKFGDAVKVVILTDAGTGQPKGSAYIEFVRKESVEHALSLDGTSFMSRILKVVRKSSAPPEAAAASATPSWPRLLRGAPTPYNFGRSPFLFRGALQSAFRPPCLAMKPPAGARSMQWKRGAPSQTPGQTPPFPPRSMTYVRTEQRTAATSDAAV